MSGIYPKDNVESLHSGQGVSHLCVDRWSGSHEAGEEEQTPSS